MIGHRLLLVCLLTVAVIAVGCSTAESPVLGAVDDSPGRELRGVEDNRRNGIGAGEDSESSAADDDQGGDDSTVESSVPEALANSEDATVEPETGSGGAGDSTDDPKALPPQPSELDILVSDLMDYVETERGHRFVSRPELELLEGDDFTVAFAEVVRRDAERYREDFDNFTDIYRAMGVIDESRTLEEIWSLFGDAGVLGYYDNQEKNIVLRGGELTPLTRTILVHELTHALDDQIFDIDRPEYDDRDDEISWSLSAIAEGNAQVIENRYRTTMSDAERAAEITAQQNLPRGVSLATFSMSFRELQFSRYRHGLTFVESLWDVGVEAVDEAFRNPPPTSELIVDPSQYSPGAAGDDPPPAPPAGGTVFEEGVWGQIGWAAIFADVDPVLADSAAEGWGGDWYVAWRTGDQTCVRANIEADSASHLDAYADLLEDWASAGDREIFYPTADLIRITACA